jgi:8-oxo-dGTP pyrophosphatase MutT (NUDIX family)
MKIIKLAAQGINPFRDRATIFLHDGKGNVLAAKQDPTDTEAPYHFPGGGVHENESLSSPIPSNRQVNKGLHREALEELGYKVKNIDNLGQPAREFVYSPAWQERVYQKRGERYLGIREHLRAAQVSKRDESLLGSEGDSFYRFNPQFISAKEMANALRQHSRNERVHEGKRQNMESQAEFLDKLWSKRSQKG